jgi:hypothetical protein
MADMRQRAGGAKSTKGDNSTPNTPAKTPAKGTVSRKGEKSSASAVTHLLLPLLASVPLFFGMLFLSRKYCSIWFASTPERPCFITLPYIGGSLMPFVFGLFIFIYRRGVVGFLPGFLQKLVCFLPLFLVFLHSFFTVFYGNINNDAWSHSLMIDVIAPRSAFKNFTQFVPELRPSYNSAAWAHESIIDGPHLDIKGVRDAKCEDRGFARFMYHRIDSRARVHAILGQGVMVGGIWVMSEGREGLR